MRIAQHSAVPRVFSTVEYYLPGVRSGGPLRSLAAMVDRLGDQFSFHLLTRNHDVHERSPHPGIVSDAWNDVGKAKVFYASNFRRATILRALDGLHPDVIYLNSVFSHINVRMMYLRRTGALPPAPLLICPRGEFSAGSLRLKAWKKRAYLSTAMPIGLYDGVEWHATSGSERDDILRVAGGSAIVHLAPNMSSVSVGSKTPSKRPGIARFAFLGRIVRMKNVAHLLNALKTIAGAVEVDLFGPIEDVAYWSECQNVIAQLPANIRVRSRDVLPHERVMETLSTYDFFVSPTFGESFGHAILEALAAGCPVIISDRTHFRGLEQLDAGWDLPLDDVSRWSTVLQHCVDMDLKNYSRHSAAAQRLARQSLGATAAQKTAAMFETVMASAQTTAVSANAAE